MTTPSQKFQASETAAGGWPRPVIVAAIHQKGVSMTTLAVKHGLPKSACSTALSIRWPKVDRIIAKFVGAPLHEIWPDRYDESGAPIGVRQHLTSKAEPKTSKTKARRKS